MAPTFRPGRAARKTAPATASPCLSVLGSDYGKTSTQRGFKRAAGVTLFAFDDKNKSVEVGKASLSEAGLSGGEVVQRVLHGHKLPTGEAQDLVAIRGASIRPDCRVMKYPYKFDGAECSISPFTCTRVTSEVAPSRSSYEASDVPDRFVFFRPTDFTRLIRSIRVTVQ